MGRNMEDVVFGSSSNPSRKPQDFTEGAALSNTMETQSLKAFWTCIPAAFENGNVGDSWVTSLGV